MKSANQSIVLLSAVLFLAVSVFAQNASVNQKRGLESATEKAASMKKFVLLVRFSTKKTLPPEQLKLLTEKWKALVEKWTKQGNFVASYVLPAEGFLIVGADKKIEKSFSLTADGFKVVSVIILSANNLEEAAEFAKAAPNLDEDGTIEIREVASVPKSNQPIK